jgi:flagellar biosynthesis protein FlhF
MKIKTFRAKTFGEALALVKKEMGEDAVILSTGEKKGLRPSVEVAAAVDYEVGEAASPRAAIPSWATPILRPAEPPSPVFEQEEIRQLKHTLTEFKAEVGSIRELLEDSRTGKEAALLPAGKRDVLRFLKVRGVREEHARGICNSANNVKEIPRAMAAGVAVRDGDLGGKKAVVLVGPTGVGKTTTVAKLAASAIKGGKRVAIVSLDSYRIGAIEQVRIYAKIMGVPLEVVPDARQIKVCLARHADKDVVFIDTTGRNPLGDAFLSELAPLYESGVPVETHLLVSATSDYDFLDRAWKSYARLPVDCVGVTKVDEAVRYGALYNVSALCGKPIAYLTNGQTVPGDIMFPTREKVLRMILLEGPAGAAPAAPAQR